MKTDLMEEMREQWENADIDVFAMLRIIFVIVLLSGVMCKIADYIINQIN